MEHASGSDSSKPTVEAPCRKSGKRPKAGAKMGKGEASSSQGGNGAWWKQAPQGKPTFKDAGRLARLERAKTAHSLRDLKALPESMVKMPQEQSKDTAHMLKTFYNWMLKGASPKSAPSYINILKQLMREHNLSLESMNTSEYMVFIKTSQENQRANGLFSASLRQLQLMLTERGSVSGPWDEKASLSDKLFDVRCASGRSPAPPVDPSQPVGEALKNMFGVRAKTDDATPLKGGKGGKVEQTPEKLQSSGSAKPGKRSGARGASNGPGAAAAEARPKRTKQVQGAADEGDDNHVHTAQGDDDNSKAAAGRKRGRPIRASSTPAVAEASLALGKGGPERRHAFRRKARASSVGADADVPMAEPEASGTASSEGAKKGAAGAVDKKELGRQFQLADLMKTARAHISKRDYGRAEQVVKVIMEFCDKEGMERPASLRDAAAKREDVAEEPMPDDAPKGDELEVARDACRRCFGLRHPTTQDHEDDSEIIPAAPKKAGARNKKDAIATDDGGAADDNSAAVAASAAKFAAIPDAEPEDYLRLHAVAAAFKAHLVESREEVCAEDMRKAFVELFQLDDKSFDAMASDEYIKLVGAEDAQYGEAANKFGMFWKTKRDQPLKEPPPRLPTSEERNLAIECGVPPSWRLQVFHRGKREDLVVLTAPDGAHEFTTKAGLRGLSTTGETFVAEKKRTEAAQREENAMKAEAQKAAAASMERRRAFCEERRRFQREGAQAREEAQKRFEAYFAKICEGGDQDGVALNGALPADCLGSYVRLAESFENRPAYERLASSGLRRSFLFFCRDRWVVAGTMHADAQPFAYVEDPAPTPHEVDRDGAPWMVPADESADRDFEEVQGAPAWCSYLPNATLLGRAFKVLQARRECCATCGEHPRGDAQNFAEDAEDLDIKVKSLTWESYDDVPNATPEERATYPTILAKFSEEGYPYFTGVRKLMARYGKSPAAMATKAFHTLVRNDPMNAVCNGFDSSAVLYFIMFWEKWGSTQWEPFVRKSEKEIEMMDKKDRAAYIRECDRLDVDGREAYEITEQGKVLQDLQIDMPLTRLIADVTSNWKQDVQDFLSPQGFLETDADASGLRALKCGADLLPEPTAEEWATWSGVLKAFDGWKISKKGAFAGVAGRHTEGLQNAVHLHGKPPAVVATDRYLNVIIQELGKDSAEAAAVSSFAEFWAEREGTSMPDPSKGLLFGAKLPARWRVQPLEQVVATVKARRTIGLPPTWGLELEPSFRATEPAEEGGRVFEDEASLREALQKQLEAKQNEQRRKNAVASEWNLPPRYEVEFEKDGTPYVMSPDGDIRYDNPDDIPRPLWMLPDGELSRRSTGRPMSGNSPAAIKVRFERDIVAAAMRMDFEEARRLQAAQEKAVENARKLATVPRNREPATDEPTAIAPAPVDKSGDVTMADAGDAEGGAPTSEGSAPTFDQAQTKSKITCEARCRAGKMPIVKKTDANESTSKTERKYTKQAGIKVQQEQQIQTGELMLKAHCWRLVGIRDADGSILPLDKCKQVDPAKVVCVLAQIAEEINKAEQERVRKQWGIDDSWQVLIRTRLLGNQVTVVNPEGKHFFKPTQIRASQQQYSKKMRQLEDIKAQQELLSLLQGAAEKGIFEIFGAEGAAKDINGVYRKCSEVLTEVSYAKCCHALTGMGNAMAVRLLDKYWRFVAGDVTAIEPIIASSRSAAPPPFEGNLFEGAGSKGASEIKCEVQLLHPEEVMRKIVNRSNVLSLGKCKLCTFDEKKTRSGPVGIRQLQREAFEQRLRDLGARRQDAPRTLGDMARHMTRKLLEARPSSADAIRRFFANSECGHGTVRLGTLCSGTDSPTIALKHLTAAVKDFPKSPGVQGDVGFEHVFSCEFDEAKQGFLLTNFGMDHLFADCTQMGRRRAWDVKSKSVQAVPGSMDFLVAGFSCKDLSFMNSYRKTLEEMGQSGRTLRGCLEYVERYRPRVVLLENVYAIDRADQHGLKQVNIVMEGLRLRGYAAGYTLLNSCDYYLPQIRHRIWMWGFRMDKVLDPSESVDDLRARAFRMGEMLNPRVQEQLKLLEEPCALHFDDLLLADDDPRIAEEERQLHAKARRRQARKANGGSDEHGRAASAKLTWQQKYTMHRMKLDYAQERPYTSDRAATWKRMLNERVLELLDLKCLDVLNEQGMDPREVPMLWDLLQSVERVPGSRVRRDRQNYASCVLPPSLLWHTVKHRFILGQEKLALQGIFEEDLKDIASFPQALLSDLAGNAFTSSVCLACMLTAAAFADQAVTGGVSATPLAKALPRPEEPDDDEEDEAQPLHEAAAKKPRRK